jgi:hypothetical protein
VAPSSATLAGTANALLLLTAAAHRRSEDRHDAFDHRTGLLPRRTLRKTLEMYVKDINAAGRGEEHLNDPRVRAAYVGV